MSHEQSDIERFLNNIHMRDDIEAPTTTLGRGQRE